VATVSESWTAGPALTAGARYNKKRPESCRLRLNRLTDYFIGNDRLTL